MEKEGSNLPAPPSVLLRPVPEISSTFVRPTYTYTSSSTTSTTTSSSSSSPPTFLRHVQAAFKRHRPLGTMRSNNIKPRRMVVPTRENPKASDFGNKLKTDQAQDEGLMAHRSRSFIPHSKQMVSVVGDNADSASITPPSEWGYTSNTQEEHLVEYGGHDDQPRSFDVYQNNATVASNNLEDGHLAEGKKRVHFASVSEARFQGANGTLATGIDDILSHMGSLALTEMEWDANENNCVEDPKVPCQDVQHHNIQSEDMDGNLRPEGGVSSSKMKNLRVSEQLHQFRNFAQDDMSYPMTQSSAVGTSCATSTLINPGSATVLNSTTYCSEAHMRSSSTLGAQTGRVAEKNLEAQLQGDLEMKLQARLQREVMHDPIPASKCLTGVLDYQATAAQMAYSNASIEHETKQPVLLEERRIDVPKNCHIPQNPSEPNKTSVKESTDVSSGVPLSSAVYSDQSDVKLQSNKSGKLEKGVGAKGTSTSRKKNYDTDLFFKVNGKLYQRLGKIGSGGSSEVHKVISSDCTIYALKKIKLKGRDYATAFGFCQEIEYLKKLKGKNNIIQLIDYEVTDKALLHEVINGSQNNKDGRVRDDGFIYMVLEYGEIDLAHMLSHKWKELDSSCSMIDENWLRFYWQQILLAVNTIHEERIVHSDLKPANFLLVRGSLKLIDFGIAKAIMSDTTNIQRDSQVGTLSYMSPEAFMCNETDANGNTIKCGRPSDIWSLGCILYQMVYGRTPFSEYKTFWAKFKVITDPNHEIIYEPVSNPWLLDLMKNCLAWDRNQRWRIPQLLQHPFLVPPIPAQISTSLEHSPGLLKFLKTPCKNDPKAALLFSQLEQLLGDPISSVLPKTSISLEEQRKLLREMSDLCLQLDKHLGTLKESDNNNL